MNALGIDYGTKRVGIAISISGIISPLTTLANDDNLIDNITKIVSQQKIDHIYVGLSEGKIAMLTANFVSKLRSMLELPIDTVEESVSTIEAESIRLENKTRSKNSIDSLAAAVILNRVIS